jgi:tRNA1Val (adenine37-N6)-methyltransferase
MFHFKQFSIKQDLCAMKVGTDGVLLGAWVVSKGENLLDIGSGTGLLALMLAQRNKKAVIDAIDIDEGAYLQTLENIKESKGNWEDRINAIHTSLQEFRSKKKYDLIFTNPPYFINSFKAPDSSRKKARHNDTLSFKDLIGSVKRLLKDDGCFGLILPINEAVLFVATAKQDKLYLNRKCWVSPNVNKSPKRVLMEFSFQEKNVVEEWLTIEVEKRHHYTKEYINLTQEFYLKF